MDRSEYSQQLSRIINKTWAALWKPENVRITVLGIEVNQSMTRDQVARKIEQAAYTSTFDAIRAA